MMGTLHHENQVTIPLSVRVILSGSSDDLTWILRLLGSAKDIEWVSDTAPLFLAHLDRMIHLVHIVGDRLETAENAVRALARSA